MKKAKVILKEECFDEEHGLQYITKDRGDIGSCFTMAIGYAVSLAKTNGISIKRFNQLVKQIYNETEDINDED